MAYSKKANKTKNLSVQKLQSDLAVGTVGQAYLFYGEETYIRDSCLDRIREILIPETFAAFNYHKFEGKDLEIQVLTDAVEAMPMMADRTLVILSDYDLFRQPEGTRERFITLLNDLPEWCCLIFVYDTIAYQPNRSMKKLYKALETYVETVEFQPLDQIELTKWITERFRKLGKKISRGTAEHLIFTCGDLMSNLNQEIAKLAAYAGAEEITVQDIDTTAEPVLSTEVFRLSDAVLKGDYNRGAAILADLLNMQMEPIYLLAALGGQLRRIYTAKLALDAGKDRYWLAELWGMKDYPARLLVESARRADAAWCAEAVEACQVLDRRMKSEAGIDAAEELKFLLARLGISRESHMKYGQKAGRGYGQEHDRAYGQESGRRYR